MSKPSKQCPPSEALTQAVSEGMSPTLQKHLRGCAHCTQYIQEEREAQSLLHTLPLRSPTAAQHQDARMALFAAAKAATPTIIRQRPWGKMALGLAASVMLIVGAAYWLTPTPPTKSAFVESRGTIFAGNQAQFHHQTNPGDELVLLTEGSITVDVAHLKPGERFRVVVGDSEIEVRGTSFEVTAHNGKLVSVRVLQGEVEIHTRQEPLVRLAPGERWVSADQIAASETVVQEPSSLPEIVPVVLPALAPTVAAVETPTPTVKVPPIKKEEPIIAPNATEETYRTAYAAYRAGDFAAASKGFAEVSESASSDLAEDASYFYAVSLHRSKSGKAKAALESFIQRFPQALRVNEARLFLGRLLLDAGDLFAAKQQLEAVVQNAPEALRKKAQDGLDAINQRTTPLE
jgi:TolA-binding protein